MVSSNVSIDDKKLQRQAYMREYKARRRADAKVVAAEKEYQRRYREEHQDHIKVVKKQWRAAHPDMERASRQLWSARQTPEYLSLRKKRFLGYQATYRARKRATRISTLPLGEVLKAGLRRDPIFTAAANAIPATLPSHVWDDAVSLLRLAILEGEVRIEDVRKAAGRFVKLAWGSNFIRWTHLSPGRDNLRLIHLISNETEHY